MDYSLEQAKSIFDLIAQASPYAIPLLISLIFPIIWVLMKKTLGVDADNNTPAANNTSIIPKIKKLFSFSGGNANKRVLNFCIVLFFTGLIILKAGEQHEESIRQKALALKEYFIHEDRLFAYPDQLPPDIDKELLDDILFKFPSQFIYHQHALLKGYVVSYVDSSFISEHRERSMPLLSLYLQHQFLTHNQVYTDSLYDLKDYLKRHFSKNYVYHFISLPENKEKYYIDTDSLGREIIIKK